MKETRIKVWYLNPGIYPVIQLWSDFGDDIFFIDSDITPYDDPEYGE